MDVLQPFVPLGNSGTVPRGRRLESALVRLRGGGKWWVLHSFSIVFLNKGGVPAGGRLLVTKRRDKTSVYATSRSGGVGEGGCHHATSRCGNVDKNNQKHYKNEYNNNTTTTKTLQERVQSNKQTNKQRSKKQGAKKETNKHTNNQQKNKHTNRQRTKRHNTSSTNNKSNLANTQQQEERQQQEDHLGPTCFRRACADDPTA